MIICCNHFKIGKKFNKGLKFGDSDFDFDDWDREARVDGWICRNDQDCNWIDDHLACDDRDFSSSRLNVSYLYFNIAFNMSLYFITMITRSYLLYSGKLAGNFQTRCERSVCLRIWLYFWFRWGRMSEVLDRWNFYHLYYNCYCCQHYCWVMLLHWCCLFRLQIDEMIPVFRWANKMMFTYFILQLIR